MRAQTIRRERAAAATRGARVQPPAAVSLSLGLLARQIVRYVPGALVPAAVGLLSTVVFTRIFGSAEYGRYSLALATAALLSSVTSQWLQQGTTRFLPGAQRGAASRALKGAVALSLLLVGGSVAVVGLVIVGAGAWLDRALAPVLAATLALVLATSVFTPLSVLYQAEMRPGRYTSSLVASVLLRFVLSLALVLWWVRDPVGLILGNALALAALVPLIWSDARLPSPHWVLRRWRMLWVNVRRLAAFGFPMVGWVVAAALLDAGDRYVIQLFRGSAEVGIYAANYSLVTGAIGLVAMPVLWAAHPFLMRAWGEGNAADAGRWLGKITGWFITCGILLLGGVSIFDRDIADLLLGPEFREGHHIIPVVLAGLVIWQLGMYTHKPLEFAGRTRLMLWLALGAAAVNLGLNMLFVPRFGYTAAAYTTLAAYTVYALITARAGRQVLSWRVEWRPLLRVLGITVLGLGTALAARSAVDAQAGYGPGVAAALALSALTAGVVLRGAGLFGGGRGGAAVDSATDDAPPGLAKRDR